MTTKRTITPEAREKATETRQHRSIFNRYLASMKGKRTANNEAKIVEIDDMLAKGTKERIVPKFVEGKRVGTETKDVPLLPADRARLLAKSRHLHEALPTTGKETLREEFLDILPEYAASQGWTREILLQVGVPAIDLDAAGLK